MIGKKAAFSARSDNRHSVKQRIRGESGPREDVQQLIGVTLTNSCVMIPSKSVSGIFYSSEHDFQTCQLGRRENCSHRSAPFDPHMWELKLGGKA